MEGNQQQWKTSFSYSCSESYVIHPKEENREEVNEEETVNTELQQSNWNTNNE